MRARVFSALLLLFSLSLHAQSVSVWPSQVFTASAQTGTVMKLNSVQGIGSANSGTLTLVGTSLTTVTFSVKASTDNGLNYFAIPLYTVASPSVSAGTTVTATASGQYQFALANVTNLEIVTSGTFTATSVSFQLTTSPNGQLAKSTAAGTPCSGCLVASNNLSDVADAPTAQTNLGVQSVTNGGTGSSQAPSTTGQVCISQSTTFCTPQTISFDATLAQNGAITVASLGGLKPALRVGATAPTLFSGTTSQNKTLLSSTPAAGAYQACAYIDVTVAATAGTFQPAITYVTDGNTVAGQNIFATGAVSATGQWTVGQACYVIYADAATAITMQLKLTGVTGTPTFRYWFTLYQQM